MYLEVSRLLTQEQIDYTGSIVSTFIPDFSNLSCLFFPPWPVYLKDCKFCWSFKPLLVLLILSVVFIFYFLSFIYSIFSFFILILIYSIFSIFILIYSIFSLLHALDLVCSFDSFIGRSLVCWFERSFLFLNVDFYNCKFPSEHYFAVSIKFWCVVFSFSFIWRHFKFPL